MALAFCWAVLGAPTGKRLAPIMVELVPRLRRFGELVITDDTELALLAMSPATIDRRLAPDRAKMLVKGHSHTKPGSLLKDSIPIRTWAEWNDAVPGFVEIDLVGHEGGNALGEHCYTLTVTDIATGWTENRSVRNKAEKWVFEALMDIRATFPFPIIGIDSDNGSEFINWHLLRWCEESRLPSPGPGRGTATMARTWSRRLGGRADRGRLPPVRHRGRVAATEQDLDVAVADDELLRSTAKAHQEGPQRCEGHQEVRQGSDPTPARGPAPIVTNEDRIILADTYRDLNPAALQRQIQALTEQLLAITTSKTGPHRKPSTRPPTKRASAHESTTPATRAS